MLVTSKIIIDLTRKAFKQYLYATQDDSNTRAVEIALLADKEPWKIPEGTTGAVSFKKPDKTSGFYDTLPDGATKAVTFKDNRVTAILAPQVLTTSGEVDVSIALLDSSLNRLGTFPFTIRVEKNPSSGQDISNDYYSFKTLENITQSIGDLDDLKTANKTNLVDAVNEVAVFGSGGGSGNPGEDGGYYTPTVTDNGDGTMTVSFTPSDADMPAVEPVTVTLPEGPGISGVQLSVTEYDRVIMTINFTDGRSNTISWDRGTPVKGVDYWTEEDQQTIKDDAHNYIATELAKRGQLEPIFANSIEECTDTTKLYVLPDGYIYAYMKYCAESGPLFTNLADPDSSDWLSGHRYNASNAIATSNRANAFVSNFIPCKLGDIIRIKGVADYDSTAVPSGSTEPFFRIKPYDAEYAEMGSGKFAYFLTQSYSTSGVADRACAGVTIDEDGVVSYEIFLRYSDADTIGSPSFAADITYVRISGVYTGVTADDVIITVNEEIAYSEGGTTYQWASTGHAFVPADYEDRIAELEAGHQRLAEQIAAEVADLQEQIDSGAAAAKSGARWAALGDSITQGWTSAVDTTSDTGYKQYLNTAEAERWVNIVAEMNGYELTNRGIGGTGYLRGTTNARVLVDTLDFSQCDFVTLAYGVNDWKYAVNIGTEAEIPQTIFSQYDGHNSLKLADNSPESIVVYKNGVLLAADTDYTVSSGYIVLTADSVKDDVFDVYNAEESMVSNMSYVIKKILRDNPLCKIFVITPINCKSLGTYVTNWGINYAGDAANNLGLEDIFQLQKTVCEYHGIELIDMTHSSIINRENIGTLLADNVHPTVEGHKQMARELAQKIHFR